MSSRSKSADLQSFSVPEPFDGRRSGVVAGVKTTVAHVRVLSSHLRCLCSDRAPRASIEPVPRGWRPTLTEMSITPPTSGLGN